MKSIEIAGALQALGQPVIDTEPDKIDIASLTPAEAVLYDLRRTTAESVAHHALVTTVVDSLPKAELENKYGVQEPLFRVDKVADARRLRASLLWGPPLDNSGGTERGGLIEGVWPYYIVGQQPGESERKRRPKNVKLLLASAVPYPQEPERRFLEIETWEAEMATATLVMAQRCETDLGIQTVRNLYDEGTLNLALRRGFGLKTVEKYDLDYTAKAAAQAEAVVQEGTLRVAYHRARHPRELVPRIPADAMRKYDIMTHLIRLAHVFERQTVMAGALPATVHDGPTALERYVEEYGQKNPERQ